MVLAESVEQRVKRQKGNVGGHAASAMDTQTERERERERDQVRRTVGKHRRVDELNGHSTSP